MDEKKELEGLAVGDKVWSPIFGEVEVESENEDIFTISGWGVEYSGLRVGLEDKNPVFFRNEESFRRYWKMEYTGEKNPHNKMLTKITEEKVTEELVKTIEELNHTIGKMQTASRAFDCADQGRTAELLSDLTIPISTEINSMVCLVANIKGEK